MGNSRSRIRGGTCNPCFQHVFEVDVAASDINRGVRRMSRGPCHDQDQQCQAGRGCMTMYARLWWSALFGRTLGAIDQGQGPAHLGLRNRCLIRFSRHTVQSVSQSTLAEGPAHDGRHSHVPNKEAAGRSLAFHLVRFCASSFLLVDDLECSTWPRWITGTSRWWRARQAGRCS